MLEKYAEEFDKYLQDRLDLLYDDGQHRNDGGVIATMTLGHGFSMRVELHRSGGLDDDLWDCSRHSLVHVTVTKEEAEKPKSGKAG